MFGTPVVVPHGQPFASGVSFCIQAIRLISLHKFSVAFILLAGLFVYDIFWVGRCVVEDVVTIVVVGVRH